MSDERMNAPRPLRRQGAWLALGLALLLGLFLAACSTDASGEKVRIDWNLSDSLKNYSKVVILIVDPHDSSLVIDTVYADSLGNPQALGSYTVDPDLGGNYRIRILGFDAVGLLAFESRIDVMEGAPKPAVRTPQSELPAFQIKVGALLAGLDVSDGVLSPEFKPGVFAYTVTVPFQVKELSLSATAADSQSTLTLDGEALASGSASDPIPLLVGEKKFSLTVKAKGGSPSQVYTLTVRRGAGNVSRLASLGVSAGELSPHFSPDSMEYDVTVPVAVETLAVSAVPEDPFARVTVGDAPLDTALGHLVTVAPGATVTLKVTIRSQDSSSVSVYTLNLSRALSSDAALANLLITAVDLVPEFHPDTLAYKVESAQTSVAFLPTARAAGARIKVNGTAVASGSLSGIISIPATPVVVTVEVTAADGSTVRNYSVSLKRAASSNFIQGLNLTVTGFGAVPLDTPFQPNVLSYRATVRRQDTVVNLSFSFQTPSSSFDPSAVLTFNGVAMTPTNTSQGGGTSSLGFRLPLALGVGTARIVMNSGPTYFVRILRPKSKEADLSQMSISAGVLKPAFSATVLSYTDTVSHSAASITVNAAAKDPLATVILRLKRWAPLVLKKESVGLDTGKVFLPYKTFLTDTLLPGKPSKALELLVGHNLVEIQVIAEDTTVKKTYSVSVERRPSPNSFLAGLALATTSGTALALNPAFTARTTTYSAGTTAGFVTVTPAAGETGQSILVNGKAVASGNASGSIALVSGANSIKVEVTAPDKEAKTTYTLNVTRTAIIIPPRDPKTPIP